MPIMFSYDLENAHTDDRCRISLAFERLGWEGIGGSCWRYPALGVPTGPEDYFNRVQPALSFFRDYVSAKGIKVSTSSLDGQLFSYYRDADSSGFPILPAGEIDLLEVAHKADSTAAKLSKSTLRRYMLAGERELA
jgi:hypothetical protein